MLAQKLFMFQFLIDKCITYYLILILAYMSITYLPYFSP